MTLPHKCNPSGRLQGPRTFDEAVAIVNECLAVQQNPPPVYVSADDIAKQIAAGHGLTWDEALSKCRKRRFVLCRDEIVATLHKRGMSHPEIAKALGGRNSSTIFSAYKRSVGAMA